MEWASIGYQIGSLKCNYHGKNNMTIEMSGRRRLLAMVTGAVAALGLSRAVQASHAPTDGQHTAQQRAMHEALARQEIKELRHAYGIATDLIGSNTEAGIAEGHGFVRLMTARPAAPEMAEIMFAANQMLPVYARRAMSNRSLQSDEAVPLMKTPMLLLVGDQDGSQSVEALTGLAKRLPDGRIKVMPGAGHAAFIDSPQEFDDALREFEAYAATRH